MNIRTRILTGATVGAIVALLAFASGVSATPPAGGPPGQGECSHGNSQATCRPDPQPSHGQDCDEHGPHEGGVNEDHCADASPSPSPTSTPSPSVEPSPSPTPEP